MSTEPCKRDDYYLGGVRAFIVRVRGSVEVVFRNLDHLVNLSNDGEVFIRAERISDAGTLGSPQVTISALYQIINNEVRIRLPDF